MRRIVEGKGASAGGMTLSHNSRREPALRWGSSGAMILTAYLSDQSWRTRFSMYKSPLVFCGPKKSRASNLIRDASVSGIFSRNWASVSGRSCTMKLSLGKALAMVSASWPLEPPTCTSLSILWWTNSDRRDARTYVHYGRLPEALPVVTGLEKALSLHRRCRGSSLHCLREGLGAETLRLALNLSAHVFPHVTGPTEPVVVGEREATLLPLLGLLLPSGAELAERLGGVDDARPDVLEIVDEPRAEEGLLDEAGGQGGVHDSICAGRAVGEDAGGDGVREEAADEGLGEGRLLGDLGDGGRPAQGHSFPEIELVKCVQDQGVIVELRAGEFDSSFRLWKIGAYIEGMNKGHVAGTHGQAV